MPEPRDVFAERVTGLDGGQLDGAGNQIVMIREHELQAGRDAASGSPRRRVRFVLDLKKIAAEFVRQ